MIGPACIAPAVGHGLAFLKLDPGPIKQLAADMSAQTFTVSPPSKPFNMSEANKIQVAGSHYKGKTIQPWDFIAANELGYFEGNIVKYVSRWRDKGGVDDLRKAQHYLQKLIELQVQTPQIDGGKDRCDYHNPRPTTGVTK